MNNNKVLVTIAIGEEYQKAWEDHCKPTWEPYADKHGYDIVIIKDFLDTVQGNRTKSINWQKCLIFRDERVQRYDHVVWMDTDIVVNYETAPCIVSKSPDEKIGVVLRSQKSPNPEDIECGLGRVVEENNNPLMANRDYQSPSELYSELGYTKAIEDIFNTGIMVFRPHHQQILEKVYNHYEESPLTSKEMVPLSYHLLKKKEVTGIDPRFNKIFDTEVAHYYPFLTFAGVTMPLKVFAAITNSLYCNSFFLHFINSATRQFISLINPGGNYPETILEAYKNVQDMEFTIGKDKLETKF